MSERNGLLRVNEGSCDMGLAERRALKGFEENRLPEVKRKVAEIIGKDVELDANWDELFKPVAENDYYHPVDRWDEIFEKCFVEPLYPALENITSDDMGREALQESLVRISFRNTLSCLERHGKTFEDGTLTIDQKYANLDESDDRTQSIIEALESGL